MHNRVTIVAVILLSLTSLIAAQDFTTNHEAQNEAELPVLDFSKFVSGDVAMREEFVESLRAVLSGPGFFYIENHGITEKLFQDVLKESTTLFFENTMDQKREYLANNDADLFDGYEEFRATVLYGETNNQEAYSFNMSHLQQSVDESPFSSIFYELPMQKRGVILSLLRAYALVAGIDENYFVDKHRYHEDVEVISVFKINNYPKIPDYQSDPRLGPHSDFMTISMVYQTEAGLEVWNRQAKRWEYVEPKPGTLVVNTGDMMQIWSNGMFQSTLHRVRAYDHTRTKRRMSTVLFVGPREDIILDSSEVFPNQERQVQPTSAHNFVRERMGAFRRGDKLKSKENTLAMENSLAEALQDVDVGKTEL